MKDIRMINQLTGGLYKFYHGLIILIALMSFGLLAYFWKIGFLDDSRSKDLHRASYVIENHEVKTVAKRFQNGILKQEPKVVIKEIDSFLKKSEGINNLIGLDQFETFRKSSGNLKKKVYSLISYPKTDKVINVFNDKMQKFTEFIIENKWQTLSRMSKRIFQVTKSRIDHNRLAKMVSTVERDFEQMIKITKGSVLTRPEKSEILSRISNLTVEMTMLKNYINDRDKVIKSIETYGESLEGWYAALLPEISLKKIQMEKVGKYYVLGLLSILTTSILMLFGGLFFQKRSTIRKQAELQSEIEKYISEGLLESNDDILESYTDTFQNYSLQMREYIGKRMSFGSIFQEAIPLGAMLLDHNLKVIWANKHFLQEWQLVEDDVTKGYISWDFLSKLTNIGENDPVIEALKFQVAGIYQVQIKVSEDAEVQPYEMFVSPVKYNGEKRVMIFFYSLMSLQQTITDQARGIVSPIEKTLDAIVNNQFDQEKQVALVNEYEIGNIRGVYEKFLKLYQNVENAQFTSAKESKLLANEVQKLSDRLNDLNKEVQSALNTFKSQKMNLQSTKEKIIEQTALLDSFSDLSHSSNKELSSTLDLFHREMAKVETLLGHLNSVTKTIPNYETISGEFKRLKRNGNEMRANLQNSLHQFIHMKKRIQDEGLQQRVSSWFETMMEDYKKMEAHSIEFEKKVTAHEVTLSKSTMLLNDLNRNCVTIKSDNSSFEQYQHSRTTSRQLSQELRDLEVQIADNEQGIINEMQKLFHGFKSEYKTVTAMQKVLAEEVFQNSELVQHDNSSGLTN
jgi:hypothetical protein